MDEVSAVALRGRPTVTGARRRLGERLKELREDHGFTQLRLSERITYSRTALAGAETGRDFPSLAFWKACDAALAADGELVRSYKNIKSQEKSLRLDAASPAQSNDIQVGIVESGAGPAIDSLALIWPARHDTGVEVNVMIPGGRYFSGSSIPVKMYSAVDDGRIVTAIPKGFVNDDFMRRARRGLIIGTTIDELGTPCSFGIDTRHARRKLNGGVEKSRLLLSRAFALDDLTLGLLWAVTNFDEPLLDDDASLHSSTELLEPLIKLSRSAGARDIVADLSPVSQMWLGSNFCARHIMRHVDGLTDVPIFWTREQRGEEAGTWLFFEHKFKYLRDTAARFGGATSSPARVFCIPSDVVAQSGSPERILLMLSFALMESFGIRVDMCDEQEYAAVQGFVLDHHRQAILANWVGTEGIWYVDVARSRPQLRELFDAAGYAQAHSISRRASGTALGRLSALADYLELDAQWLARRCAELSDYGTAALLQPRSRLLSVEGVDRACRFMAGLAIDYPET